MKRITQLVLLITVLAFGTIPASACWFWPFGGMWGAGYQGTPVSAGYYGSPGYYSAGYAPMSTGSYGGYYSAGYASPAACCAPICCDPCGSACGSGSCAGLTDSGTLKPSTDPNFGKGSKESGYERDNTGGQDATDNLLDSDPKRGSDPKIDDLNRDDDFGARPERGTGSGASEMFDSGPGDQINRKPPMGEIQELPATEPTIDPAAPGDGKTFLEEQKDEATGTTPAARRFFPQKSLAERSSGLSEVVRSKRLASRSLPASHSTGSRTSFAGRSHVDKSTSAPVRWISVPMPEGHARL